MQALPKDIKIKKAYIISVFINDLNWDALSELFKKPFDYPVIKNHAEGFTLFHSKNDPYCPLWHAETVAYELDARLIVKDDQGHFNTEKNSKYTKFPLLLT